MPHAVNLLYNFSTFYFADFMALEKKITILFEIWKKPMCFSMEMTTLLEKIIYPTTFRTKLNEI